MPPGLRGRMTESAVLLDDRRSLARARRTELVLVNLDGSPAGLATNHAAARDQLEGDGTIELRRPTDGQFQPPARKQILVGGEQDSVAAHIDGLAETNFVGVLAVQNLVPNFAFDRKAVRSPPVVLLFV